MAVCVLLITECISCDTSCISTCQKQQSFCKIDCQTFRDANKSSFSWTHCTSKGQLMGSGRNMFSKSDWDSAISYINKARTKGLIPTGIALASSSVSSVAPFSATEFNRISGTVNGPTVRSKTLIQGTYFSTLESAINSAKISATACNNCNAGCNACNILSDCVEIVLPAPII